MPAITWDLHVEAGSWEPEYIVVSDPDTGQPMDLTAPGFSVRGVVATRPDGTGRVLADWPDTSPVWSRTATGRLYFQPAPAVTAAFAWRRGFHQIEMTHPSGQTVRIAEGQIRVSPELVT